MTVSRPSQTYRTRKLIEKQITRTGAIPASIGNLTNLQTLELWGNANLQKPDGCPKGDMIYDGHDSKERIAAFLRCL